MPGLNGLEAAAVVSREHPGTRTIVLSMHGTDAYVLEALRAGATGYLLKDAAVAELPLALRAVLRGEIYISSAVSRVVVNGFLAGMAAADAAEGPPRRPQRPAAGNTAAHRGRPLDQGDGVPAEAERQDGGNSPPADNERLQIFDVPAWSASPSGPASYRNNPRAVARSPLRNWRIAS